MAAPGDLGTFPSPGRHRQTPCAPRAWRPPAAARGPRARRSADRDAPGSRPPAADRALGQGPGRARATTRREASARHHPSRSTVSGSSRSERRTGPQQDSTAMRRCRRRARENQRLARRNAERQARQRRAGAHRRQQPRCSADADDAGDMRQHGPQHVALAIRRARRGRRCRASAGPPDRPSARAHRSASAPPAIRLSTPRAAAASAIGKQRQRDDVRAGGHRAHRQRGIHPPEEAPQLLGHLRFGPGGSDDGQRREVEPLRLRHEHRRPPVFRQRAVFAVLDDADDLDARPGAAESERAGRALRRRRTDVQRGRD